MNILITAKSVMISEFFLLAYFLDFDGYLMDTLSNLVAFLILKRQNNTQTALKISLRHFVCDTKLDGERAGLKKKKLINFYKG